MVNVNQATGTWLVGGELLETEMFGRRKTFWPIKGQWARQTLQGQARRWGAIYTFKWMEWQISTTSSRPRQALCLCHCDGALPESPRVVWRREFWCPEAGWGVRGLICVPPPPTLRTVEDGCARVFCQRPHYPYIFMPLYSPRVFFFLEISTLQDLTNTLSRNVGNRMPSEAMTCPRRTDTSHLHILFKSLQINDCKQEEDNLKLWRYIRQN